MTTKTTRLRPFLHRLTSTPQPQPHNQTRTFFPNPFAALSSSTTPPTPQILTATRTLPYAPGPIYAIISDVASYSSFLPYCQSSTVTKWSAPDATYNRRWPSEGKLVVGYGNLTESFTSRVYCIPGKIVESVGGGTETSLDERDIGHHLQERVEGGRSDANGLLTHLRSRWSVVGEDAARLSPPPLGGENGNAGRTRVTLELEFAFANPMYAALSGGVASTVAEIMVKAFEGRVEEVMRRDPGLARARLGDIVGEKGGMR
ncbi:hypothetical protein BU24DRAFT_492069 [Aaosphaeria arxii CBS 175.79]|uniref:Coenzyme Q-binding protein COQ10 START domain-containing protein n=1 Tax=Aaosphaeria arxii CBS 175.79 TaxID=1450172 RepID=A0A6A5XRG3_9PLEO|nr:uncharacterized protein BU24DRAFT_492069 [Aaosphaeria arxii CBS 175.79]KAF2015878.1 hypothetical protein BU24DRAFT_492069 [Aaosphaeria arxii CBS 175.79]